MANIWHAPVMPDIYYFGMPDIWYAASRGDLAEVQRMVGQYPGLLHAYKHTWTALMQASACGHVEVARWLVDQGAALDQRHETGHTALYKASEKGQAAVVRLLLEWGADPTIQGCDKGRLSTPLIQASKRGHLETVLCLLDHFSATATINHPGQSRSTALWWAGVNRHTCVVRALLDMGADPTIADDRGRTAMAVAKGRACIEALKVRCACRPSNPPLLSGLTEAWGLVLGVAAGGGAGLPAMEGPAGG
jgi:uncharacterized protein